MADQNPDLRWEQTGWLEEASGWISAALGRLGIEIRGGIEQPHVRPWSTVLRVPTALGAVYFKATTPVLAHEPALAQSLFRWRPDCAVEVLAADSARGWMLMGDAGAMLRTRMQAAEDIHHWDVILPLYAGVQLELADRPDELLALGTLDRRLSALPRLFEQLLRDEEALSIDHPAGMTAAQHRQLLDLAPRFEELCAALAGYSIPETLQHDDFHDGNVFVSDERYIFTDWAESCVAHPFFTMVVTLRSVENRFKLDEHAPELDRLRDIYLACWARYGSDDDLRAAFYIAMRVGMVNRALTWHHVLRSLPPGLREEHREPVPGWLVDFLGAEAGTG